MLERGYGRNADFTYGDLIWQNASRGDKGKSIKCYLRYTALNIFYPEVRKGLTHSVTGVSGKAAMEELNMGD